MQRLAAGAGYEAALLQRDNLNLQFANAVRIPGKAA